MFDDWYLPSQPHTITHPPFPLPSCLSKISELQCQYGEKGEVRSVTWCLLVSSGVSWWRTIQFTIVSLGPGTVGCNYSTGNHGDNNYITSMVTHIISTSQTSQHGNVDSDPLIQHCECQ